MVPAHRDLLHRAREKLCPCRAAIGAPEQRAGPRVDHAGIDGIEEEELHGPRRVEQSAPAAGQTPRHPSSDLPDAASLRAATSTSINRFTGTRLIVVPHPHGDRLPACDPRPVFPPWFPDTSPIIVR